MSDDLQVKYLAFSCKDWLESVHKVGLYGQTLFKNISLIQIHSDEIEVYAEENMFILNVIKITKHSHSKEIRFTFFFRKLVNCLSK
jgi:hypothetical protein